MSLVRGEWKDLGMALENKQGSRSTCSADSSRKIKLFLSLESMVHVGSLFQSVSTFLLSLNRVIDML